MNSLKSVETSVMDAIDAAIREVFQTMLGKEVKQIDAEILDRPIHICEADGSGISVVLGWTGELQGSLTLTLSEASAAGWTAGLLGDAEAVEGQDVVDAVGELGNLVVGCAKSKLSDFKITMSLPVVIHAGLGSMGMQSNSKDIRMVYDFDEHRVTILVALGS